MQSWKEKNIPANIDSILNPVNAFLLIRQLSVHWEAVQKTLHDISEESKYLKIQKINVSHRVYSLRSLSFFEA